MEAPLLPSKIEGSFVGKMLPYFETCPLTVIIIIHIYIYIIIVYIYMVPYIYIHPPGNGHISHLIGQRKKIIDSRVSWVYGRGIYIHMGVSKNRGGPPKFSILIGVSLINHPFWGTTIFGNAHIY